ncbi:hypothetical protein ACFPES_10245 [Paenibacillus sp. GCM10023248]|uniref:hypothetical protein n=1 Tax=unclassified Paenibacillus TaxID=185978 RepID=UPI002377D979|nr:hypothetical protein [Paenibacillus sp. MAHUQ-63]MDD9267402.1 hypothetical protein [Paenibacillus sp. MAHUQ-63]
MRTRQSFIDSDQQISLEFREDHLTVLRLHGETTIYPFKNITLAAELISEYPGNHVELTVVDFNTGATDFKFSSSRQDFECFVQKLIEVHHAFVSNP